MVSLTKFRKERTKIVDFLLIVTFLASPENKYSPSIFLERHGQFYMTCIYLKKQGIYYVRDLPNSANTCDMGIKKSLQKHLKI